MGSRQRSARVHGVYEDEEVTRLIANRLRDEKAIECSRVFPYQLMTAWQNVRGVPREIEDALQDAMEHESRVNFKGA